MLRNLYVPSNVGNNKNLRGGSLFLSEKHVLRKNYKTSSLKTFVFIMLEYFVHTIKKNPRLKLHSVKLIPTLKVPRYIIAGR